MPVRRRAAWPAVVVLLLTGTLSGARQSGTAVSIQGVVLDAVSRQPVSEATVTLVGLGGASATTGRDGRFTLVPSQRTGTGLRAQAAKAGYLTGLFGQLGPNDNVGGTFDLVDGQKIDNLSIRLWPAGVITGRVVDADGQGLVRASVMALTRLVVGGMPRWWRATVPVATDDRGEYRLERLPPNAYVIAVRPAPSVANGMVPPLLFAPGVRHPGQALEIASAGDLQRADLRVSVPNRSRVVSGRLITGDRSPLGMLVRLLAADPTGEVVGFDDLTAKADAQGIFVFPAVAYGLYRIQVCEFPRMDTTPYSVGGDFNRTLTGFLGTRPPDFPRIPALPAQPTLVADQPLQVGDDLLKSVEVVLAPGARIRGRVEFRGNRAVPSADELLTIPLVIRPADGGRSLDIRQNAVPQARIEADRTFASVGLPPGNYVVGVVPDIAALKGWHLSTVSAGALDLTGKPLVLTRADKADVVVTFTDSPTEIHGTITTATGSSGGAARAIVFPKERADRADFWAAPSPRRVAQGIPDAKGVFRVSVPPGDYLVAAISSDLPALWMAPQFLQLLEPRAVSVSLRPGEQRTIGVAAVAIPRGR